MQVLALALPSAPNIGFIITGCGVGIEAFASPILAAIIIPPLITTSGFTPKRAGFQITKSANFPTSKEPMTSEVPVAKAGLIVYLAIYLFAAEDVLHDIGAISIINSDSQAMGRPAEVITRTWQLADKNKKQRGKLPEEQNADNDNFRAVFYFYLLIAMYV